MTSTAQARFSIRLAFSPRTLAIAIGVIVLVTQDVQASCSFAPVKAEIDTVIDKDERRGAEFRRKVKEGYDSIAVLDEMVTSEMRKQIDICRFFVAEYLAKRGFPPAH